MSIGTNSTAKIGLILPSVNTVTEPLFYRLAPKGLAFFSSRVFVGGSQVEDARGMEHQKERAARELASARVDLIVDCCTGAGVLRGLEGGGEKAFCDQLERITGIPATTTFSAVLEAFKVLDIHKLVITSPYLETFDALEKRALENLGFEVLNIRGFALEDSCAFADVDPQDIREFSKKAWNPKADGLFMSCMNLNAVPAIEALETELEVPVLSSNSATLWKILRAAKVHEPVLHCGRLLTDFV